MFREIGGFDLALLYAGDLDLCARLCRKGDYLHINEPLFYGRTQAESSSSVNPKKLWDVIDYFVIPEKLFRPRKPMNLEWRRYYTNVMLTTARYLVNVPIRYVRGDTEYARNLLKVIWQHGNVPLGVLYAPIQAFSRLHNYVRAKPSYGNWLPPESGMGTPSHWGKLRFVNGSDGLPDNARSSDTIASP